MQSDANTAAQQLDLCWVIIQPTLTLSAVGWPLTLILGPYVRTQRLHPFFMDGISTEVCQFWTNTLKWQPFGFLPLVPLGPLCRSLIFTACALCRRYILSTNAGCPVFRLHLAPGTRWQVAWVRPWGRPVYDYATASACNPICSLLTNRTGLHNSYR